MPGVSIIEMNTTTASNSPAVITYLVLLAIANGLLLFQYLRSMRDGDYFCFTDEPWLKTVAIIVILACSVAVGTTLYRAAQTETTTFVVEVDETVSMIEFTEKYEIIDQNGNIYTVKEKTE